ncbi:hypothetical protein G7Y79_00009g025760 [Physcia stellaris]|nr:hypothetical protein G7Y79_00009g025760 [Physcia stellaris]
MTAESFQREGMERAMLQITKILPLWARLEGDNQYNIKLLIDHKVGSLTRGFRYPNLSQYELLDRLLDFEGTIKAAGFDTGSVKALIDEGVKSIMLINGLPYVHQDVSNELASVQGEVEDRDVDKVEEQVPQEFRAIRVEYGNVVVLTPLKKQHGRVYFDATTGQYRLEISYDWSRVGRWLMLGPDTVHAFFQDADYRMIIFMLSNNRPWLSLELASSQDVIAFVAAFEEKYVGAFRVSMSPYTRVKAYFKNT